LPALADKVTTPPELVRLFPYASLARTVMVATDDPFAGMEAGEVEIVVVAASASPGATVNALLAVTPPAVAARVIGPAAFPVTGNEATPAIAVAGPSPSTDPLPPTFEKVTTVELSVVARFPVPSRSSTVSARCEPAASGAAELVKTSSAGAPDTTANVDESGASPAAEAVTVTSPAAPPVTVFTAVPPDVDAEPSPAREPPPAAFPKVIARPQSFVTMFPCASSTSTFNSREAPERRSAVEEEKCSLLGGPGTVVNATLVPVKAGFDPSLAVTV
jgi:hypothetical protein